LKPTRVQIRNEEHHKTGSINQQELFQIRNVSWKSLTVQTVIHASGKFLKRRWGPNGNYHMVLDGMGFQRVL
jgi:hypothetical protein